MDFNLAVLLLLSVSMLAVIAFDAWSYVIPNTLNLAIAGLYPFAAYLLGLEWQMALVAAGLVLFVGMAIFALGLMGGGDIKLLAVLCLYTGWGTTTPQFLVLTALFGGVLVALVIALRLFLPPVLRALRPTRELPRLFAPKQPIPYGLAIAAAFLFLLWTNQIPGIAAA